MPTNDPSLITGLDPAQLFALGATEGGAEPAAWEPPSTEEAAALFPQWEVRQLLGRGGMGAVYLMHQPELDREVAVKLLPIEASRDERHVERFRREARALAKLRHPGIVALHEAGVTPAGHLFFVMEFVNGRPLSSLIAEGKVATPQAIEIVRQVCDALACAHAAGIVHRDIKPSNVLIDAQGHVKVADFGLARWDRPGTDDALSLSRTGMFMGTPAYTAPEQARDAAHADHRADIYSLGVLLYEMLTGELPRGVFQPPSRKSGSDARLDDVVQRALQERPEDRYQAAAELKKDVTTVQHRSPMRLAWLLPVIALLLGGGWFLMEKYKTAPAAPPSPPPARTDTIARAPVLPETKPSVAPPEVPPAPATVTPPPSPAPSVVRAPEPKVPSVPIREPRARVWSLEPVAPALLPSAELLQEEWKDAVLIRRGGALLLADRKTIVIWSESTPGKTHRVTQDLPIKLLAGTPDSAIALDETGRLFRLPDDGASALDQIATDVRSVFSSASNDLIGGLTSAGAPAVWSLRGGAAPMLLAGEDIEQLAVTSDGTVWAVNHAKRLLRWDQPKAGVAPQITEHTNVRKISAAGGSLMVLLESGELITQGEAASTAPAIARATDILAAPGCFVGIEDAGRATLWGSSVPDAPQRVRLPAGTTHLRVSATGVLAAW